MGVLAIALGIGGAGSWGAALHLVNNGLIKVVMFLAVGNMVRLSGSPEVDATRGLLHRAPWTSLLLFAGLFAVTGSPPFGLFVSEFTILGAAFHAGLGWLALLIVVLLAIVFVAMARLVLRVIVSEPQAGDGPLAETFPLVGAPVMLTAIVLMLGVYVPLPLRALLADAARALGGMAP
jgi:hydrogenase-4 component F